MLQPRESMRDARRGGDDWRARILKANGRHWGLIGCAPAGTANLAHHGQTLTQDPHGY